ncbi:MAG TPA: glycosyl hydrolase [Opitutaceae bacterium]|nr:glycosyl hydrolase [Opitutaceae bacterium]
MRSPRHLPLILLVAFVPVAAQAADVLADGFRHPPADARPQTWWHWMNGNISREGIKADLEAMKHIGLGGAQIFNATQGEAPGPVKVFSPEWYGLVHYAISEANRLGLKITIQNCAGWSESGGPWVTPAEAMQRVVWSELRVHGPQSLSVPLPEPTMVVAGYCADIATLAFPAAPAEARPIEAAAASVTSSTPGVELRPLLSGNGGHVVELPMPAPGTPQVITVDFGKPQLCGSIRLVGREYLSMPVNGVIEASDDGATWRRVAELPMLARGRNHPSVLTTFPETTARFFRISITKVDARAKSLVLTAIDFGDMRLAQTEVRAGFRSEAGVDFIPQSIPRADSIAPDRIVNLTPQVHDGRLQWDVPPGDWTIVRFCHTPTGQMNAPAPEGGRGWECDKMSRAAVDAHFDALMGRIIAQAGPLAGQTFAAVLADSWEAGSENWTPAFRSEFMRRRGYDLLPYLPVLTGRVVGNVEISQRFLWDFRRTIGDLIAENYYGEFRALCHQHGMEFTAEAPGINMPTVADELECKGRTDVPMGEFWMDGHNDTKETASAAHIYGTRIAAAEAFTAKPQDANWTKAPFDHKMLGDLQFTTGINRLVFHRYAHQPWLDRVPGMAMGRWGTNFERTNTWWNEAGPWMEYLTRCQYLLQRGVNVDDVCYFYGENVPNTLAHNEPLLPPGYGYDACNAEVLMKRMEVRDGRLVLPDGTSYALLLLADSDRMTPELLARIRDFVAAGATVVGRRPTHSPSLTGFPRCDEQVLAEAKEVWGDCDGKTVTEHDFGRGHVFWGLPLSAVLKRIGVAPDFVAPPGFAAIHRRIGAADVYFVSSQHHRAASAELTFRVAGRMPELWHADTGRMERTALFREHDGGTTVRLSFAPAGSVFVIFRAPDQGIEPVVQVAGGTASGAPVVDAAYDPQGRIELTTATSGLYTLSTADGKTLHATVDLPVPIEIGESWSLHFPAGWGAPTALPWPELVSWTDSPEDGVKYFSGTARYTKTFDFPRSELTKGRTIWLDLGTVREVASVTLNGVDLGILWKPPFEVDITRAVRAGQNRLEVKVTNLWPNRLIGDQRLPVAQRHTWTTYDPYKPDSPLLPSGLLGPVRLTFRGTAVVR